METGQVAAQTDAEFMADLDRLDAEWSDRVALSPKLWRECKRSVILGETGAALVESLRDFLALKDLPVETDTTEDELRERRLLRAAKVKRTYHADPVDRAARLSARYAALAHGKR